MKLYYIYILLLSLLFSSQSKVGTTSGQFLGIGVGARAMAMGGAFTSMIGEPISMYWNPGSISSIKNNQAEFLNVDWLIDTQWNYIGYINKLNDRSTMGANLFYLDYGEEEITTIYDQQGTDNYWSAYDLSLGLYYGINLTDRFSFGGGAKYIKQSIYNETASTIAIDIGLLYQNYIHSYRIGMSISNIGLNMILKGNDLYFNCDLDSENQGNNDNVPCVLETGEYPLKIFYRIGLSKDFSLNNNLLFTTSSDWVIPSDDVEHLNIGFEFSYIEKAYLRFGYRQLGKRDTEEGLTFGIGGKWNIYGKKLDINYNYHDFGIFGYMQYFEFIFNL